MQTTTGVIGIFIIALVVAAGCTGQGGNPALPAQASPTPVPTMQAGQPVPARSTTVAMTNETSTATLAPVASAGPAPVFNASLSGDRNLGQPLVWTIYNVSGTGNVTYTVKVYDYTILGKNYTYWSHSWGRWYTQSAAPGSQYLVVWARVESEGIEWFGWGQSNFLCYVWGNTTIYPDPVPLSDEPTSLGSGIYPPADIRELQSVNGRDRALLPGVWYGWDTEVPYVDQVPGSSNAWDGMILYEVPETAQPNDIRIHGGFANYGFGIWYLTPHEGLTQVQPS